MERQRYQPSKPEQRKQKLDRPTAIVRQFIGDTRIREKLINPQGDYFVRNKAKKAIYSLDEEGLTALTKQLSLLTSSRDKTLKQYHRDGAAILLSYSISQIRNKNEEDISQSEVEYRRGNVRVLWELNLTQDEIAKEIGTSRKVVEKDLSRMRKKGEAVPYRAPKPSPSEVTDRREKVKELDGRGLTPKQIAEKLGEDRAVIRRDLYLQKKAEKEHQ